MESFLTSSPSNSSYSPSSSSLSYSLILLLLVLLHLHPSLNISSLCLYFHFDFGPTSRSLISPFVSSDINDHAHHWFCAMDPIILHHGFYHSAPWLGTMHLIFRPHLLNVSFALQISRQTPFLPILSSPSSHHKFRTITLSWFAEEFPTTYHRHLPPPYSVHCVPIHPISLALPW